jgi:hypothetical protein
MKFLAAEQTAYEGVVLILCPDQAFCREEEPSEGISALAVDRGRA